MRTLVFALATAATLLPAAIAHADQCRWMTEQQAIDGAKQLAANGFGTTVLDYCEPCGDTEATPKTVRGLSFNLADDPTYYQVKLNGNAVDLAYMFVFVDTNADGKPDTYKNVASLAGCPVQDVSLEFAPGDVKISSTGKADEASGDGSEDGDGGGCSTTGSASPLWLVGLGLAFAIRRRRR